MSHPEYYNCKMHPEMKLPADMRKLRDVKIKEVPSWLMKRDWSPLGMYFSVKRFKCRLQTKFYQVRNPGGNFLFICAFWLGTMAYVTNYKYMKHEKLRKYH